MRSIDALTVEVVVDNTTDMLSSRPSHVTSELGVLLEAGMPEMAGEALCSAHHGLCLAVTAHVEGDRRTVLFDAGPDPYALDRNGTRMGIDFGAVEAIVLSHGHFDHAEGLPRAVELIRASNGNRPVPIHVHPGAFVKRALRLPTGTLVPLRDVPSRDTLEALGAHIVTSDAAETMLDGCFSLSGEIPRQSFERGLRNHFQRNSAGEWEEDPLVVDERFMMAHVKGKGLVVFTGCSHAGVVNTCRHARELAPDLPLYGLVGGLHLVRPNEDLIPQTIAELKALGLSVIVAGHCTGWRAIHALVSAFGEPVVDPLAVGSRLSL